MTNELNGKVAVTSGGSRGNGKAIAHSLAAEGCDILLVGRTETDLVDSAAQINSATGRRIEAKSIDLRTEAGCEAVLAARAGITADEFKQQLVDKHGVRRLGQPEDVAALLAFLCSPMARHIQGVAIAVDGGGTKGLF